jgi:hypothetical protein
MYWKYSKNIFEKIVKNTSLKGLMWLLLKWLDPYEQMGKVIGQIFNVKQTSKVPTNHI